MSTTQTSETPFTVLVSRPEYSGELVYRLVMKDQPSDHLVLKIAPGAPPGMLVDILLQVIDSMMACCSRAVAAHLFAWKLRITAAS